MGIFKTNKMRKKKNEIWENVSRAKSQEINKLKEEADSLASDGLRHGSSKAGKYLADKKNRLQNGK